MPVPPVQLSTPRLHLRRVTIADAPALFEAYASDPEAVRFLSWKAYTDVQALVEFLARPAAAWELQNGHYIYAICPRDIDRPFGTIGMIIEGWKVVFGYVIGRSYWNFGYTTEALRACVGWALEQPELRRIWAYCDVQNPASGRVMEKSGLEFEGVLRHWHVCPNIGPAPRDCRVYSRIK